MPTLLRWKGYKIYFWSGDRGEPPHVNVRKGRSEAKIWLDPVTAAKAVDCPARELKRIVQKVEEHRETFLEAWYEHFGH